MALYKHVVDKDDLVAGMIDSVVARYPAPNRMRAGATRCGSAFSGPGTPCRRSPTAHREAETAKAHRG